MEASFELEDQCLVYMLVDRNCLGKAMLKKKREGHLTPILGSDI